MASSVMKQHQTAEGVSLLVCKGNICTERTDCIVNAANECLQHLGGVAGAISRAGGPEIQAESNAWLKRYGKCTTGKVAAVTSAGSLPCTCVIHVAGPVWGQRLSDEVEVLGKIRKWDGRHGQLVLDGNAGERKFSFLNLAAGYLPEEGQAAKAFLRLRTNGLRFVSGMPPSFVARQTDEDLLRMAVIAALRKADELGMQSIAIPAIGSGVFGFPSELCAEIQIKCALTFSQDAKNLKQIRFTNIDDPTVLVFVRAFDRFFPKAGGDAQGRPINEKDKKATDGTSKVAVSVGRLGNRKRGLAPIKARQTPSKSAKRQKSTQPAAALRSKAKNGPGPTAKDKTNWTSTTKKARKTIV